VFGECLGDLPREIRREALRLVDPDELLQLRLGIFRDAGSFGLEQGAVHLPLGPFLGIPATCGGEPAGHDHRRSGQEQRTGRRTDGAEALGESGRGRDSVVHIEDRIAGILPPTSATVSPDNPL
jgi:hypothetical protein